MTNEFAIKVLTELRGYGDKFANIGFDRKEALDLAIKALEQTELNPSYNGVKTELEPCEDCISRKEALRHGRLIYDDDGKGYVVVRVDEIIDLPSVTPTRPKGKWIHWTDDYKDYVTCSCCGYGEEGEVLLNDKTPFCSICGADMRGETE